MDATATVIRWAPLLSSIQFKEHRCIYIGLFSFPSFGFTTTHKVTILVEFVSSFVSVCIEGLIN